MNQDFLEALAAASADTELTREKLLALVEKCPNENLEAVYTLADANGWTLPDPEGA